MDALPTLPNSPFILCMIALPIRDGRMDLVSQHLMYLHIGYSSWKPLLQEYFRILRPGGCIDMMEVDALVIRGGECVGKLNRWFERTIQANGVPHRATRRIRPLLNATGFVDTEVRIVSVPVGPWAGRMGVSGMRLSFQHYAHFQEQIFKVHPELTMEEFERTIAQALLEINEFHAYRNVFVYTARKPQNNDAE